MSEKVQAKRFYPQITQITQIFFVVTAEDL